jgi:O-antigen ligase
MDGKPTRAAVCLIIASVAAALANDMVRFLNVKHDPDIVDYGRFPLARDVSIVAAAVLFCVCLVIIVRRVRRLPHNFGGLTLILLALFVLNLDWSSPTKEEFVKIILAAAVIFAVWAEKVPVSALKWISVSGSVVGLYTLSGALFAPEYMNYRSDSAKAFIANWQLAGPFAHSNALAIFCILAACFSPLIVSVRWRILNIVILFATIVATASRTALIAVAIVSAWWLFCRFLSRRAVRLVGTMMVAACAAAVVAIPLVFLGNPYAISARGYAWATSIGAWRESRLFGLDNDWFTHTTHTADPASWPFRSGHNLFIDVLVKSGLVGICVLALVLLIATLVAIRLRDLVQQIAVFAYLAAFLVESTAEATWQWFLLPTYAHFPVVGLVFTVLVAGDGAYADSRIGVGRHRRGAIRTNDYGSVADEDD